MISNENTRKKSGLQLQIPKWRLQTPSPKNPNSKLQKLKDPDSKNPKFYKNPDSKNSKIQTPKSKNQKSTLATMGFGKVTLRCLPCFGFTFQIHVFNCSSQGSRYPWGDQAPRFPPGQTFHCTGAVSAGGDCIFKAVGQGRPWSWNFLLCMTTLNAKAKAKFRWSNGDVRSVIRFFLHSWDVRVSTCSTITCKTTAVENQRREFVWKKNNPNPLSGLSLTRKWLYMYTL